MPALRSTNIPGYDSTVSGIVFDQDLGRASYVVSRSGKSVRVRRFTPETLAAIARRRRAAHERATRRCHDRVAAAAVLALNVIVRGLTLMRMLWARAVV